MSFICIIIKNHFHINGFPLSLALKVRFFETRKWPITSWIIERLPVFLLSMITWTTFNVRIPRSPLCDDYEEKPILVCMACIKKEKVWGTQVCERRHARRRAPPMCSRMFEFPHPSPFYYLPCRLVLS